MIGNPSSKKNGQLEILLLNCNSIYKKLAEIKQLVNEKTPDLMCFCETWLRDNYLPKFKNYTAIWKNRIAARGGGIGIIVKNCIQYQEVPLVEYQNGVLEVQAVRVFLEGNKVLHVLNLYNPSKNVTIDEISHYTAQLGDNYLIIGDLNAHSQLLNEETSVPNFTGRTLETFLLEHSVCLVNPINMFTYIDRSTGRMSCLDICIATSNIAPHTQISPFKEVGSDHIIMKISVSLQPSTYKWLKMPRYNITKKTLEQFRTSYVQSTLQKPASTEDLAADLINRISESANICFGQPTETEATRNQKRTPWWNEECAAAVRERRKVFRKFQKHPVMENFIQYKKASAKARFTTRTNKQRSLREFISSLTHNTPQSTVWRKIKSFKSGYTPQTFPLIHGDVPILDPYEKAEILNKTFKIKLQDQPNEPYAAEIEECFSVTNFTLNNPITMAELNATLNKIKDKTPGFDMITNKMLKSCHESYKDDILYMFNQSLALGEVPVDWKFGLVLPILKAGKKPEQAQAYRPITLLPCMGKLLEKILQARLENFLESGYKLSPFQFGFRPGKGTEDIIIKISEQIRESLSTKQACCVVYIDLKGAFDRVWRHGLLYKASQMGIVGKILRWLSDYLDNRTQSVVVHGNVSSKSNSDVGVPQGGILSPLLFNLILYDIPKEDNIELYIFADDITIAFTGQNTEIVEQTLQAYLDRLHTWFEDWGFMVNPSKTKMQFYTRKRILKPILCYNEVPIEAVKEQRLLGVVMDAPLLTWKSHISFLVTDCTKRLGMMRSLSSTRFGASFEILRRFYKTYIRPRIAYCASSFCQASNSQINRLNVIQNNSLRLMMGARRTSPISSLEAETNVPPLVLYMEYLSLKTYVKLHYRPPNDLVTDAILKKSSSTFCYNSRLLDKYKIPNLKRRVMETFTPAYGWYEITENIITDPIDPDTFESYMKDQYPGFHILYTDGSKQESPGASVSSGLYDCQGSMAISWKLNPEHSVIAAELFALKKALEYIQNQRHNNWIICTDSLSSLQLLSNDVKSYRETTDDIKSYLRILNRSRCVKIHWVKGHSGISGNEIADRVASLGHTLNRSTLYILHKEEINNMILRNFNKHWQECWVEDMLITGKGKHLGRIRNTTLSPTPVDTGSRVADVAIFRLRLGHAGLNKHLFRIKKADSSYCSYCNTEETIEHYLLECKKYDQPRNAFQWTIVTILKKIPDFTLKLLLGGEDLQPSANTQITKALAIYLRATGRLEDL